MFLKKTLSCILCLQLLLAGFPTLAAPANGPHLEQVLEIFEKHFPENMSKTSGIQGDIVLELYYKNTQSAPAKSVIDAIRELQRTNVNSFPEFSQTNLSEIFFEDFKSFEKYMEIRKNREHRNLTKASEDFVGLEQQAKTHKVMQRLFYVVMPISLVALFLTNTLLIHSETLSWIVTGVGIPSAVNLWKTIDYEKRKLDPISIAKQQKEALEAKKIDLAHAKKFYEKIKALNADLEKLMTEYKSCRNI